MHIRFLNNEDLPSLIALQREAAICALSHIFPQDLYPFPTDILLEQWSQEVNDPSILAYGSFDESGAISGFGAMRGLELLHFGTAVMHWGTGLASIIHDYMLNESKSFQKDSSAFFWLRVFEQNHRARRFYEKHGWFPTNNRSRTSFPPCPTLIEYRLTRENAAILETR